MVDQKQSNNSARIVALNAMARARSANVATDTITNPSQNTNSVAQNSSQVNVTTQVSQGTSTTSQSISSPVKSIVQPVIAANNASSATPSSRQTNVANGSNNITSKTVQSSEALSPSSSTTSSNVVNPSSNDVNTPAKPIIDSTSKSIDNKPSDDSTLSDNSLESATKLSSSKEESSNNLDSLSETSVSSSTSELNQVAEKSFSKSRQSDIQEVESSTEGLIEEYQLMMDKILIEVKITQSEADFVPNYIISITNISTTTKIILEKIREEFVSTVDTSNIDLSESSQKNLIKEKFKIEIIKLLNSYFPNISKEKKDMLISYLIEQNLGLGHLEILLKDASLEEIVVNNAKEPIWVYHRKHGWLKTNIILLKENKIRHYATMIGRDVNKEITVLNPLLDAHLVTGDRVNATLNPISTKGNTITIRKFAADPWTITGFLKAGTINYYAASVVWQILENELSIIIAGGTGSGKTSMLNVVANFLPPNHRIISIEDTRELTLPDNLHWVPMETRLPNPEGRGGVAMIDLLVNSLRMRPDRIVVGEIRRKEEAQVLLEAMHTGHSVYGTFHANTANEAVIRLTNDPINIAKPMLSSIGAILVQNRDRRTGKRRTLQVSEITENGDAHVFVQYDPKKDAQVKIAEPTKTQKTLYTYTGMSLKEQDSDIKNKMMILKWLVQNDISDINQIGIVMAKYARGTLFKKK